MTELANTTQGELSLLDSLAVQAKTCVLSARMNLLQLGRVLTEAKPLVPHGEWEAWVKTNAEMSARAAQSYMQAYATFGLNPDIAKLGATKTMKLLPLSEEERETLFAENDVEAMSTRQLDEAIRRQKEKIMQEAQATIADAKEAAQKEIERERKARIAAEQRAETAESRKPELPVTIKAEIDKAKETIREQRGQIETLTKSEQERYRQHQEALCENRRLQQEIHERDELIEEQQQDYNRIQMELLDAKSAIAKGDAERVPSDQLTPDAFASAVRVFIGSVARMPHMITAFSRMADDERREYDELLKTVESWARDSRRALDTVEVEGVVIEHV